MCVKIRKCLFSTENDVNLSKKNKSKKFLFTNRSSNKYGTFQCYLFEAKNFIRFFCTELKADHGAVTLIVPKGSRLVNQNLSKLSQIC